MKNIENLNQKPFNTTFMGAIFGIASHYNLSHNDAILFGGSGHAFVLNIHKELCPSGPYAWDTTLVLKLLENLGISSELLGSVCNASSIDKRKKIETELLKNIKQNHPCYVCQMEYQIIDGFDDNAFLLTQPWGENCSDLTPNKLSFKSWDEFGDTLHACFLTTRKCEPSDILKTIKDSLEFYVTLNEKPTKFQDSSNYTMGISAYDTWITATENGFGNTHGNWWNAQVWSENREMASQYLSKIKPHLQNVKSELIDLTISHFHIIALNLGKVADKKLDQAFQIELLQKCKILESQAFKNIKIIYQSL
jgi:hypothetical protein